MTAKIINLFAGPGTGKSTTAAALFAELKYRGVNCEYIQEYAKDVTWEKRGPKVFECQEYIFGKQHFRIQRTAAEVDFIVTDCPILMGCVYAEDDFKLISLVLDRHYRYDSLNVFLKRADFDEKAYNPAGRNQTQEQAVELDTKVKDFLVAFNIPHIDVVFSRYSTLDIMDEMQKKGWITP